MVNRGVFVTINLIMAINEGDYGHSYEEWPVGIASPAELGMVSFLASHLLQIAPVTQEINPIGHPAVQHYGTHASFIALLPDASTVYVQLERMPLDDPKRDLNIPILMVDIDQEKRTYRYSVDTDDSCTAELLTDWDGELPDDDYDEEDDEYFYYDAAELPDSSDVGTIKHYLLAAYLETLKHNNSFN